jgi:hypothetical protein
MFRIICDPSSGSVELYLTEIIGSGSQVFVVCTWQTPANHYEWITYVPEHVGVIFNFVSFKLLYNVDFNL